MPLFAHGNLSYCPPVLSSVPDPLQKSIGKRDCCLRNTDDGYIADSLCEGFRPRCLTQIGITCRKTLASCPGAGTDLHPEKRPPAGLPGLEPWSVGYGQHPRSSILPRRTLPPQTAATCGGEYGSCPVLFSQVTMHQVLAAQPAGWIVSLIQTASGTAPGAFSAVGDQHRSLGFLYPRTHGRTTFPNTFPRCFCRRRRQKHRGCSDRFAGLFRRLRRRNKPAINGDVGWCVWFPGVKKPLATVRIASGE